VVSELANQHYVDTNTLPWIGTPGDKIQVKVMRLSAETGHVSMIVKQSGPAPAYDHLGPADLFTISGVVTSRSGPSSGYTPLRYLQEQVVPTGTYMLKPAGARHDAMQPVDTDAIYIANLWGPIQFDAADGTTVGLVLTWKSYFDAATRFNSPLVANTFENDSSLLAPFIEERGFWTKPGRLSRSDSRSNTMPTEETASEVATPETSRQRGKSVSGATPRDTPEKDDINPILE